MGECSSLALSGTAVFYGPESHKPVSTANDYRMWRIFDQNRQAAHGPDGKVRIIAKAGDKLLFEVGFDGETTWTEKGVVPQKEADKFWANSFGFGIIRQAGKPGFIATRIADGNIEEHALYMVELIDPAGGKRYLALISNRMLSAKSDLKRRAAGTKELMMISCIWRTRAGCRPGMSHSITMAESRMKFSGPKPKLTSLLMPKFFGLPKVLQKISRENC